jgi:hypothetical protein
MAGIVKVPELQREIPRLRGRKQQAVPSVPSDIIELMIDIELSIETALQIKLPCTIIPPAPVYAGKSELSACPDIKTGIACIRNPGPREVQHLQTEVHSVRISDVGGIETAGRENLHAEIRTA